MASLPKMTDAARRARIAVRHRLLPGERTDDVAAIADDLVALHSSDPSTVHLSAGARMVQPSIAAVEAALYEDRTLLRHHGMRRTLWVMTPPVARLVHASCTVDVAARERRQLLRWLAETPGIDDPERWLADATERLVGAVTEAGLATTRQLGGAHPDLAVPLTVGAGTRQETTVAAHSRVLLVAAFEGRIFRTRPQGSWTASGYRWAPAAGWHVLDPAGPDRRAAGAALVERWLRRFGPGTESDLRWWTGWTAGATRAALVDAGAEAVVLESGEPAWVAAGDTESPDVEPWVALLPGLDPTTMGWKERAWYLDAETAARVFDRNGNGGPTVWIDGRIAGGWVQRPDGDVVLDLPDRVRRSRRRPLDDAMGRVREMVGETRFRVRFPSPNQKELLGGA